MHNFIITYPSHVIFYGEQRGVPTYSSFFSSTQQLFGCPTQYYNKLTQICRQIIILQTKLLITLLTKLLITSLTMFLNKTDDTDFSEGNLKLQNLLPKDATKFQKCQIYILPIRVGIRTKMSKFKIFLAL
uniref:Uncharacterized protein n=1 Tax=Cacopsylla melanoneura TaxID=428564 RepID=A0A8D8YL29_9HEMI